MLGTCYILLDGRVVDQTDEPAFGEIWHSDKGEWTLDTINGPYYRLVGKDAREKAIALGVKLAAEEASRRREAAARKSAPYG